MTVSGANGIGGSPGSLGLLLRLEQLGQGYDAEGRLRTIGYNKLDWQSDSAFYDVTDDCVVDISDVSALNNANGSTVGQPGYNPRYDLNSDGYVDISDVSGATGFGAGCPRFVYDAGGNLVKLDGPKRMVLHRRHLRKELGYGR